ncbi:MAG: hypothetical protein HQK72_03085 [Desulfamplus sp.]|nr:hypothetical protein [Desulfamplus sp.]
MFNKKMGNNDKKDERDKKDDKVINILKFFRLKILIVVLMFVVNILIFLTLGVNSSYAGDSVVSNIKVILASSEAPLDSPKIDPTLKDISNQLQSVFKYTSYQLIDSHNMSIAYNTTGIVSLPDERTLEIVPGGMSGDRIKFTIRILKKNSPIFTTQILLKNGSSVTIGGPDYNNGYLLFNISGVSN